MRNLMGVLVAALVFSCGGGGGGTGGGSGGSGMTGGGTGGATGGGDAAGGGSGGATGGGSGGATGGGTGGATGGGTGGATGGGTGGAGGGTVTPLPLTMNCDALATAICTRQVRCNWTNAAQLATCIAAATASCNQATGDVRRATAGMSTYDAQQARRCVDAYATLSCAAFSNGTPRECNGIFTADGGTGSACASDSDCRSDLCDRPGNACGTCVGFAGVGQLCTGTTECDFTTSYCPNTGNDGGLLDGGGAPRCIALLANGTPCDISNDNLCLSEQCNYPLDGGGAGVCGFPATGTQCDDYFGSLCAPNEVCKNLRYTFDGTDENLARLGTCRARDGLGQACTIEPFGTRQDSCFPAANCLDGTCKPARSFAQPIGGGCLLDTDCFDNHCVFPPTDFGLYLLDGGPFVGTGTCASRVDAGFPCDTDNPCTAGTTCQSGTCVALHAAGGTCGTAARCQNFLTCPDAGATPFTCQVGAMNGQGCNVPASNTCQLPSVCQRDGGVGTSRGTCISQGGTGSFCLASAECTSSFCRQGGQADGGAGSLTRPGSCVPYCF